MKAGMPLSDGAVTFGHPECDGSHGRAGVHRQRNSRRVPFAGREINDKHFEVIVRQMMKKVVIEDGGDTQFLEKQIVEKAEPERKRPHVWHGGGDRCRRFGDVEGAKWSLPDACVTRTARSFVVTGPRWKLVTPSLRPPSIAPRNHPCVAQTKSFISAAFQETTKVLNEAAVSGKQDHLLGLKENVIVGHLIPAGTGTRDFSDVKVGSKEEFDALVEHASQED